jgi:hypothetical protein
MTLPEHVRNGLGETARRFEEAGIAYQLGGSAMLRLSEFDVAVGDIDVVVAGADRDAVVEALEDLAIQEPPGAGLWRTDWLIRATLDVGTTTVGLDVMGGLALMIDGVLVRFPLTIERSVVVDGWEIPLAPLAHWYHIYRVHNPAKAAQIRERLDVATVRKAARELSIPL